MTTSNHESQYTVPYAVLITSLKHQHFIPYFLKFAWLSSLLSATGMPEKINNTKY